MKTLDEVIKAFECCENGEPDSNCEECSYIGIGSCCLERENDALHYLKDMKNLEEDYDILYNKYWRYFNQQQTNPPLTLEELKAMRGKPVWIEYIEGDYENEWVLVVKNPERPIFGVPTLLAFARDGERIYLTISGYGKRWQAYRNMK